MRERVPFIKRVRKKNSLSLKTISLCISIIISLVFVCGSLVRVMYSKINIIYLNVTYKYLSTYDAIIPRKSTCNLIKMY